MRKKKIVPLEVDHRFWNVDLEQGKHHLAAADDARFIRNPKLLAHILKGKQKVPYPFTIVNTEKIMSKRADLSDIPVEEHWRDLFLASNSCCFLYSSRFKTIIDAHLTGEEGLEWIKADVYAQGERRTYYTPRFTRPIDYYKNLQDDAPFFQKYYHEAYFSEISNSPPLVNAQLHRAILDAKLKGVKLLSISTEPFSTLHHIHHEKYSSPPPHNFFSIYPKEDFETRLIFLNEDAFWATGIVKTLANKDHYPFPFQLTRVEVHNRLVGNIEATSDISAIPKEQRWPDFPRVASQEINIIISRKMKEIIERHLTGEEKVDWLTVTVHGGDEKRTYYTPRFSRENPDITDAIRRNAPLFALKEKDNTNYCIYMSKGNALVYPRRLCINEALHKELQAANLSGIGFRKNDSLWPHFLKIREETTASTPDSAGK